MNTLGLSFDFHDASAAIVVDGELVTASSEERFSLQKNASYFPIYAVESSLSQLGISAEDLDNVIFYEKPHEKFLRILDTSFSRYPLGLANFTRSMKKWLGSSLWVRNTIANELGISPCKIEYVSHHHSHIAQAFGDSPFNDCAVLVIDAVGELACTSLAEINSRDNLDSIKEIESYDYPDSIGLIYAAFTAFLGFQPNSGESSTMALAAFGSPRYVDKIEKIIRRNQDNTYSVEPGYFDFDSTNSRIYTGKLVMLLGQPKKLQAPYSFSAETHIQADVDQQRYADIAASLQAVLEDVVLGLCTRLKNSTLSTNLCFAGGVALNCIFNSAILKSKLFDNVFVPSNPGDGGAATGAAYLGSSTAPVKETASAYLGPMPSLHAVTDFLNEEYLHSLYRDNIVKSEHHPSAIRILHCHDEQQLVNVTVEDLSNGRIVGWIQGQLEFGPRALGNRSLLIDPANQQTMWRLSNEVKQHAAFRPYALSIQSDVAKQVLDCDYLDQNLLRWMQSVWPVRNEMRENLVTGLHINHTTRPQVCYHDDNPLFWRLLGCFGERNGLPALLNTSFNERGVPIVANALQAIVSFLRTGIDTLVIERAIIRKVY